MYLSPKALYISNVLVDTILFDGKSYYGLDALAHWTVDRLVIIVSMVRLTFKRMAITYCVKGFGFVA